VFIVSAMEHHWNVTRAAEEVGMLSKPADESTFGPEKNRDEMMEK
jgi:hypothetical protein